MAPELPAVARHMWLAFLAVNAANAAIGWVRGRPHRERDPSLREGYRTLALGLLAWGSLPWLVLGLGLELGGVAPERYFDPRSADPWVRAWFTTVVGLWVLSGYWIFLRGGAEQLVRHPGFVRNVNSPAQIKLSWAFIVGGCLIGFAAAYQRFLR